MPENQQKNAMDEFLADIPTGDQQKPEDILTAELMGGTTSEKVVEEPHKNRFHRRLESKYQAEREANIALAARIEAMTEAQKFSKDTNSSNVDENLIKLYGSDEKGLMAARITQDLLNRTREEASASALEAFQEHQESLDREVQESRNELDGFLEGIEDEFNVDLTSDTPAARKARQGFFVTLEKMSRKNEAGQVTDYADPFSTWEVYQSQSRPDNNRAKDLASRSMVRSGASGDSKLEQTAQERFLREAGII